MTKKIYVKIFTPDLRAVEGCDSNEAVEAITEAAGDAVRERFEAAGFEVEFDVGSPHESGFDIYDVEISEDEDLEALGWGARSQVEDAVRVTAETAMEKCISGGNW
jgi:hypothetical protein